MEVYVPDVISIGPYHHKNVSVPEIEKLKWDSLCQILELNPSKRLQDYIRSMEGLEQKIRSFYVSDIHLNSYDVFKMMLLDGCCLLFVLGGMGGVIKSLPGFESFDVSKSDATMTNKTEQEVGGSFVQSTSEDYASYASQLYTRFFWSDLLLLENQIPFFVIVKIYQIVTDGNGCASLLAEIIAASIEDLIHNYSKLVNKFERPKEFHHLVHLCHMYFKPQASYHRNHDHEVDSLFARKDTVLWHRVTEYRQEGIKIKKKAFNIDNTHSQLDIGFCNNGGVMEMPSLTIDPNTYSLFKNLVAFEQTCPRFGNYMITDAVFLSRFISTPDNISLLVAEGILVHQLDSDAEVCHLFRMLASGVAFNFNGNYYLKSIDQNMEMHYQIRKPKWSTDWPWLRSIASTVPRWD